MEREGGGSRGRRHGVLGYKTPLVTERNHPSTHPRPARHPPALHALIARTPRFSRQISDPSFLRLLAPCAITRYNLPQKVAPMMLLTYINPKAGDVTVKGDLLCPMHERNNERKAPTRARAIINKALRGPRIVQASKLETGAAALPHRRPSRCLSLKSCRCNVLCGLENTPAE